MLRILLLSSLLFFPLSSIAQSYSISLTNQQNNTLAQLVWKNEGAGLIENLTVWNKNEAFPSLGIGHFIWYPTEQKGPYIEQFPELVAYLVNNNVKVPDWLLTTKVAPWKNREAFYNDFSNSKLSDLRTLLKNTMPLQAKFITQRLEKGIPAILQASSESEQKKIKTQVSALTATPEGIFILLDYINFKGEGISPKERYQGEGWGLKQVLLAMPAQTDNILLSFALSADEVLTRRVKNAPKNELNWLKGWRVRVHKYPTLKID
ncbi:hypothetical protein [Psychromonas algicola]|uniref:hypothetical protein n=1 Tax=Psychromonas algicola TaxID=2555642 RepID=UPI0010678C49|nr:hypothetical protein [Psychromonas sp. RZ5]TEW52880.1 hypothetical protein E2R67_00295 [Psychromonas sp. RZ5]